MLGGPLRTLLRWLSRADVWGVLLAAGVGWAVSAVLVWDAGPALTVLAFRLGLLRFGTRIGLSLPVDVLAGGTITALALRRACPRAGWLRTLLVVAGWLAAAWAGLRLSGSVGMGAPEGAGVLSRLFERPLSVLAFAAIGSAVTIAAFAPFCPDAGRPAGERSWLAGLRSNPFGGLLARRGWRPGVTLVVALGLAALTTGLLAAVIWPRRTSWFYGWEFSANIAVLIALTVFPPAILAFIAAADAAARAGSVPGQLIRLTPLSRCQIAWGYVLSALHRSRALLAAALASLPLLVGEAWYLFAINNHQWLSLKRVGFALVYAAVALGLFGMNALAVVGGVLVGVRVKHVLFAALLAVPAVVLATLAALVIGLGGDYFTYDPNSLWTVWDARKMLPASVGAALFMLAPYILAAELLDSIPHE